MGAIANQVGLGDLINWKVGLLAEEIQNFGNSLLVKLIGPRRYFWFLGGKPASGKGTQSFAGNLLARDLLMELVDYPLSMEPCPPLPSDCFESVGDFLRLSSIGFFGGDPPLSSIVITEAGGVVARVWVLPDTGHKSNNGSDNISLSLWQYLFVSILANPL